MVGKRVLARETPWSALSWPVGQEDASSRVAFGAAVRPPNVYRSESGLRGANRLAGKASACVDWERVVRCHIERRGRGGVASVVGGPESTGPLEVEEWDTLPPTLLTML